MITEFQFSLKDGSISRICQVEFEIPADPNKLEVISTTAALFRRSQGAKPFSLPTITQEWKLSMMPRLGQSPNKD